MNLLNITDEYNDYERNNSWKDTFQNAKFDSEAINFSCTIGRHSSNLKYNRYRDILPYDHSRVVLNDAGDTDYINANFVECKLAKRKYILAQGPLLTTCEHFWQMIWEQNSKGIIMLNRILEKGARKCEVYYPNVDEDDSELEMIFGKFQISYSSEQPFEDYVIRKLEVENLDLKETREVYHCHYTNWPDFGEPSDKSFLNFLEFCENLDLFNASQQQQINASSSKIKLIGPPVIHCSAGVGRSGTLVLIDSVLSLYKLYADNIPMKIIDILSELRRGRMGLVQTHQQFKFAYESIIDGIKLQIENNKATASSVGVFETKRDNKPEKHKNSFSSDDDDDEEYKEKVRRRKQRLLENNSTKPAVQDKTAVKRTKIAEDDDDDDDDYNDVESVLKAINDKKRKDDDEFEVEIKDDDDDDNSSDDSSENLFNHTNRNVSTVKVNQKRTPISSTLLSNIDNIQYKETKSEIEGEGVINKFEKNKEEEEETMNNEPVLRQRNQEMNSFEFVNELKQEHDKREQEIERIQNTINRLKPYLIGGSMFIFGILFVKLYESVF